MKTLFMSLILALSMNAMSDSLSNYSVANLPAGTKLVISGQPLIQFAAKAVGGYPSQHLYIGLNDQVDSLRNLEPRTCVVTNVRPFWPASGLLNAAVNPSYDFQLASVAPGDTVCEKIILQALWFPAETKSDAINTEFAKLGISLVLPPPITL